MKKKTIKVIAKCESCGKIYKRKYIDNIHDIDVISTSGLLTPFKCKCGSTKCSCWEV
jgi:hypothetical protein